MIDVKDIKTIKDIKNSTSESEDETIDNLLSNPAVRDFVLKNDLTHDDVVRGFTVLLDYIDDMESGESKRFPGYLMSLSFEGGKIVENYSIKESTLFSSRIDTCAMPVECLDADLSDFSLSTDDRRALYSYARAFINSFGDKPMKGLYISGPFRTGKTYMATSIGNEISNKGFMVFMVYYPELSVTLKDSVGSPEFDRLLRKMKDVSLLILDDFGGEYVSPFIRDEVLGVVLQYRMIKNLPIIFTSNVPLDKLPDVSLRKDGSEGEMIKALRIQNRIKETTQEFRLLNKYQNNQNKDHYEK